MTRRLAAIAALLLAACNADTIPESERLDGVDWKLMAVNGAPWLQDVTLRLDGDRLTGVLPCNAYSGARAGTAPAFGALEVETTEMACTNPERRRAEAEYLALLSQAQVVERRGRSLVLTGPGVQMIFQTREARGDEIF